MAKHPTPELKGHRRRTLRALVLERDAWTCWLCGFGIRRDVDPQRHPLAAAVDEYPARKHGGDPKNPDHCHAAHRLCNGIRGTRPPTAELRAECHRRIAALQRHTTPTVYAW